MIKLTEIREIVGDHEIVQRIGLDGSRWVAFECEGNEICIECNKKLSSGDIGWYSLEEISEYRIYCGSHILIINFRQKVIK